MEHWLLKYANDKSYSKNDIRIMYIKLIDIILENEEKLTNTKLIKELNNANEIYKKAIKVIEERDKS